MNRRLARCRHDRIIAGVAAGVAHSFDVDPTIIRIIWIVLALFGGLGIVLYIVLAIIMPSDVDEEPAVGAGSVAPTGATSHPLPTGHPSQIMERHTGHDHGRALRLIGIALIVFGGLALADALLPMWPERERLLWPIFVIGLGGLLVANGLRREPTDL